MCFYLIFFVDWLPATDLLPPFHFFCLLKVVLQLLKDKKSGTEEVQAQIWDLEYLETLFIVLQFRDIEIKTSTLIKICK
jgi:hypothetical protein